MEDLTHPAATAVPSPQEDDDLRIDVRRSVAGDGASWAHVLVRGELDGTGAATLTDAWGREVALVPTRVHLDLRRVGSCNAAGLRVVGDVLASIREHRIEVRLLVQPGLAWLLQLSGLDPAGQAEVVAAGEQHAAPEHGTCSARL